MDWHATKLEEVYKNLGGGEGGLEKKEIQQKLKEHGQNVLPEKKGLNPVFVFLKQFNSVLIYILFAAAVISFFLNHMVDVYVILGVVLINASVGFIQERKAERAIAALKKIIVHYSKVYRDGGLRKILTKELVPGDVVLLEEGDKIPADCRLISVKNFRTDESSLTGESTPVDKELTVLSVKIGLADRRNMVFMGSIITSGEAKAIVVNTGAGSEIGKIAEAITEIKPRKMHFEKKVDQLAIMMGLIAIIGSVVVFLVGYFIRGLEFFDVFLFTIASLVSAIPEGLPAVLTVVLAVGSYRMAKRNAVIRHLPAVETLGVATVIATDKTGTLTENSMTVEKVLLPGQKEIEVSGKGFKPDGEILQDGKKIGIEGNSSLRKLVQIASVCNNSKLVRKGGRFDIIGDPTEAALLVLAEKAGVKQGELFKKISRIDDLPFNPELKYRASLSVLIKDKRKEIYSLGAFEDVIRLSDFVYKNGKKIRLDVEEKKKILKQGEGLAKSGLRVLGLAYKNVVSSVNSLNEGDVRGLILVGVVGMKDPAREGVKEAIAKAKKAGIRIIMKTGDHKETAVAIGRDIGLTGKAMTEGDLEKLNAREFDKVIREVNIFARVTPEMKMKIITGLQEQGEIVAMTGDGINDAPALKKADIGVAMGLAGTDVAREASQIVLSDDNFVSIVNAVEEGRIVFQNMRQTSFYLITTNVAEQITIVGGLLLFLPLPLLPIHLLWLNLVTDGVNDVALATEPGHDEVLNEKPRNKEERIINKELIPFLLISAGLMALVTVPLFVYFLPDLIKARTVAFMSMAMFQLFNVFNMRSLKKSIFEIGMFSNKYVNWALIGSFLMMALVMYVPFLQGVFSFVGLSALEFLVIVGLASSILWVGEIWKKVKKGKWKVL